MTNQPTLDSTQANKLADKCRTHLERELAIIQKFVTLSEDIQESLGRSVFPQIDALQNEQQGLVDQAKDIAAHRDQIRQEISQILNQPVRQSTIRRFAECLPEEQAAPLTKLRQDILDLHGQVTQLNQANSMLLQQSIDIYQKILHSLSGQSPHSHTYSASGQVSQDSTISLVSTDC